MISVIIPTHHGAKYLDRAIESVFNQTYKNYEIIVVDDNNPETKERKETEEIVKKYNSLDNFCYIKHKANMNGATARNTGIMMSKGKYISFLDDDDVYMDNRLCECVTFLENNLEYGGVITGIDIINDTGSSIRQIIPHEELSIDKLLLDEMAIGTGSNIFLRSNVIREVGGFDTSFLRRQDIEFMIRICEISRIGYIEKVLVQKSSSDHVNLPGCVDFEQALIKFQKKFENEINLLPNKNLFYIKEAHSLLSTAFFYRDRNYIKKTSTYLASLSGLTLTDKIKVYIYYHNLRDTKLINGIKHIYDKIKS